MNNTSDAKNIRWLTIFFMVLLLPAQALFGESAGSNALPAVAVEKQAPEIGPKQIRFFSYVNINMSDLEKGWCSWTNCHPANITVFAPDSTISHCPVNFVLELDEEAVVNALTIKTTVPKEGTPKMVDIRRAELYAWAGDGWAGGKPLARWEEELKAEMKLKFPAVKSRLFRLRLLAAHFGGYHGGWKIEKISFRPAAAPEQTLKKAPVADENVSERDLMALMLADIERSHKPLPPLVFAEQKNWLDYARRFADLMIEKGTDRYGPIHAPIMVNILDVRTHNIPGTSRPPTLEGFRYHDRLPGMSNLLWDMPLLTMLRELTQCTGDKKYLDAALAYIRYFARHCYVPESGFYAWGGHVGWDVFTEAVGYAEACHEFGCITPLWVFDEFYAAAPAQAERGLRNLIYHFDSEQGVDFCRHATITKTVYSGWPEGLNLVHSLGWYAVAWMELYRKTGKEEYLRWTTQKIDHRLKTRDARTGLIAWDTQLDKNWTRLDALMWFIESLVKCAELCPDQAQRARYQQSAHELALACTRLPHVPTNSFIVYAVSFDGLAKDTVGRQRYEWFAGNKPVRFWGKIGHRWSPEASLLGSLFLYYYSLWGDKEFLDLGRGIFEQYMILPMPDDNNKRPVAGMYAGVIDLGVDLYLLTRDKSFLTKAEKVAEHAVRHLFRNGLFLDEKDLDYYEARSGGGQLAASLLHLHLALKKPGLKYERWPQPFHSQCQ